MNSNGIENELDAKLKSENDHSLDVLDEKDGKCTQSFQNYANNDAEKHENGKHKKTLDQSEIYHEFDKTQKQASNISVVGAVTDCNIPDAKKKTGGSWYENDKLS